MRKKLFPIISILLAVSFLALGCSNGNVKTDGQVSQEQKTVDNKEEGKTGGADTGLDIHDKEQVARFVIDTALKDSTTVKDFIESLYQFQFEDVTGDGRDEAILVPNDLAWVDIFVVGSSGGSYHIILRDERAKYGNKVTFADGFLKVEKTGGGTGARSVEMALWKWDGRVMKEVLSNITVSQRFTNPAGAVSYEEVSEFKGPLTEFEYTLTAKEGLQETEGTLKVEIKQHTLYTWDPASFQFKTKELPKELKKTAAEPDSPTTTANLPDSLFEFKGIRIGSAEKDVMQKLGDPTYISDDDWGDNTAMWLYDEYTIIINKATKKVINIEIHKGRIANGLKVGDAFDKVVEVMGKGKLLTDEDKYGTDTKIMVYKTGNQRQINFLFDDNKLDQIIIGQFGE